MTIQEAIKSGKRFKLAAFDFWIYVQGDTLFSANGDQYDEYVVLSVTAVLSDKWEIEPDYPGWEETV